MFSPAHDPLPSASRQELHGLWLLHAEPAHRRGSERRDCRGNLRGGHQWQPVSGEQNPAFCPEVPIRQTAFWLKLGWVPPHSSSSWRLCLAAILPSTRVRTTTATRLNRPTLGSMTAATFAPSFQNPQIRFVLANLDEYAGDLLSIHFELQYGFVPFTCKPRATRSCSRWERGFLPDPPRRPRVQSGNRIRRPTSFPTPTSTSSIRTFGTHSRKPGPGLAHQPRAPVATKLPRSTRPFQEARPFNSNSSVSKAETQRVDKQWGVHLHCRQMSDSVRTVVQEILRRAVQAAQADGLLAEVPSRSRSSSQNDRNTATSPPTLRSASQGQPQAAARLG